LLLLIFGSSILFFMLYLSLYLYTDQQEKHVYQSTYDQYTNEVNSLVQLNSNIHTASIIDVTFWDDLVKFTQTKDPDWFRRYVVMEFNSYDVDYIGVYGLQNDFINNTSTTKIKTKDFIPKAVFSKLYQSKFVRYYMRIPEGVVEVFGATIHPRTIRARTSQSRRATFLWHACSTIVTLRGWRKISSSEVNFVNADKADAADETMTAEVPLKDWQNKEAARLLFKRPFNLNFKNTKEILSVLMLASVLSMLVYWYYSRRWVYNPLQLITKILETGNGNTIAKLKQAPGEFGYIGNLFEENDHQRKQLEIAKRKAEESDKLKSSFLANLSHEIRTPMNAIIGFSDLLNNANLAEEDKADYLKIIRNSGSNLVSIIEDLIEMSKIDAADYAQIQGFDLEKSVNEILRPSK
jgi:hypothetical protein